MSIIQKEITLRPKPRGFHLITDEIVSSLFEISNFKYGIINLHIKHTSASISINECAAPEVRRDMENFFNKLIKEPTQYFEHNYEGDDDMPAHIKTSIIGTNISIPITNGKLNLGTWQGIYLGEHRNSGGSRRIIATIMG
ncbi:YjbQ family protein [Thiospirochaeta perfilievii]|uniref:YjbQ family protein n=1 Tax=Thiospirochaeta perfilievii TaxID=252967 RepID=A0A5C1QDJ3_9SPIO|nr:secondary thiamine-phosphate synthase enzyme YjbQ [Thiospirochaeta perfilievii]QEN05140.1 YjbQ family protein [Thiospirochaeta perfilievii]